MNCCCPHSTAASRLFSRFARRYRKRYLKKGLEPSQQQLLDGLKLAGIDGAGILEIGSGVGYLHQHLLEQGAQKAVGVDLSEGMLEEARALAAHRGLASRTDYRAGDFMELAETLDTTDIVLLDKVVCCYPDAEGLVKRSLVKARRVYALTYPRDRWYVRLGSALGGVGMWLLRSDFRSYVHSPARIRTWIAQAGFRTLYANHTIIWQTEVYVRD